jgi:O-antigen/teichoic acid export membrane protein
LKLVRNGGFRMTSPFPGALRSRAAVTLEWFGRDRLGGQALWIAAPFGVNQVVRLVTSVVLARLLAPEMFGVMLLINTLRTGAELLSDIGIGQSVVKSVRGDEKRFLNTAWTLQLLRGVLLTALTVAAAVPIGSIYNQPELTPILLAISPVFLFTGLQAPGLFLMQRHMRLRARAAYDLACVGFQCAFTIALAAVMPSVWALVWGLVVSTLFSMVMTYAIGGGHRPSLVWDKSAAREIFHFGKWIFLSTMVYFAAQSTDSIYFVAVLPLALAGVYSYARTFADFFDQLGNRAGSMLIFPKLAALGDARVGAAARLRSRRRAVLCLVAVGIAAAIAVSDELILLLFDARYHLAAFMLPVLLGGVWFRVLGSFADAMLMGCGRPGPGAFANSAKFAVLLVGLPLAVGHASLFAALLVLILAEVARWAVLAPVLQGERLATVLDDLALTTLLAVAAVVLKLAAGAIGIAPTISEWWMLGQALRG